MKVLLEGFRLARGRRLGGIDSYWEQLLGQLLSARDAEHRYSLLTACLNPRHAPVLARWQRRGATVHHWWSAPGWLLAASRLGASAETFAGAHDLMHLPEPAPALPTRGRLVVSCHDLMYLHHPQYLKPEWTDRLMRSTATLARRASYWICSSRHTRDDLVRHFGVPRGRTSVAHLGVDPAFREAAGDAAAISTTRKRLHLGNGPYFLFIGSMEPKKNLETLLRAYGGAAEGDGLRADLVVAGRPGWDTEGVRALAERLPALRERVRFTGFVDQRDLPPLLAGARALVLPSRFEGFGMPVVEAMAAATPVLCTERGSLREVSGDAAAHFDPDDVDGLAALLRRVDEDDAFCDNLRARGRAHSEDFTWENCAAATVDAYRAALRLPR